MPYIRPEARKNLFPIVLGKPVLLLEDVEIAPPGMLTYILTRIVLTRIKRDLHNNLSLSFTELRKWHACIQAAADEFYERLIVPYERSKCGENGDVGYSEILESIRKRNAR